MQKLPKPESTADFREPAVTRVKDGKIVSAVAKDRSLVEPTRRNGVKKAFDAG